MEADISHWALQPDPDRDLLLERETSVSAEALWRGWTDAALLKRWFCPAPWQVTEAEIDAKPGGTFRTVMQGPNGEVNDEGAGCVLEVQPGRRLTWTDALGPGYRPNPRGFMTVTVSLEPLAGGGTRYRLLCRHPDAATRQQHLDMGFEAGWGAAFDQLVALVGRA